jgi:hypothetical protein
MNIINKSGRLGDSDFAKASSDEGGEGEISDFGLLISD